MTDRRPLYSQTIDALRFPLAVMIVLLHNNPLGIQIALRDNNMDLYHHYPIYYTIQHLFTNDITRIAVPLFFFISGFLFFLKFREAKIQNAPAYYGGKLKGLLKTIVGPYFIWNVIYILFNLMIQTFFASYLKGTQTLYADYVWSDWLHFIWYPAGGHLWYLRDLFVVSICSLPLFYLLRNKVSGIITVLLLGIAWSLGAPNIFGLITIESFFFWSVGAFICLQGFDFTLSRKYLKTLLLLYAIVLVVETILWRADSDFFVYFERLGICTGMVLAISLAAQWLSERNCQINPLLPQSSFFTYLSHGIVLLLICRAFTMFIPITQATLIVEYFIIPPIVAGLLLWFYKMLSKYTPAFMRLLNGGRV